MIELEHGKLYLFVSAQELEPPVFGIYNGLDKGYILLKLMFCNNELSKNRWLPDSYFVTRKATAEETGLFKEIVGLISRHIMVSITGYDAPELSQTLIELTRDEYTFEIS